MAGAGGFGQSSGLGSTSNGQSWVFGSSTNSTSSNAFASNPFGSTSTSFPSFSSQSSIFGGNSTGVFGAQTAFPGFSTQGSVFGGNSSGVSGSQSSFPSFSTGSQNFGGSNSTSTGLFSSPSSFPSSSIFGGNSTGVFGTQSSLPVFSTQSQNFGGGSTSSGLFATQSSFPGSSNVGGNSTGVFGTQSSFPSFSTQTQTLGGGSTSSGLFTTQSSFPGSSNFGGNSTGVFGTQSSIPSFTGSSTGVFGPQSSFPSPSVVFGQQQSSFPFTQSPNVFGLQKSQSPDSLNFTFGQTKSSSGNTNNSTHNPFTPNPFGKETFSRSTTQGSAFRGSVGGDLRATLPPFPVQSSVPPPAPGSSAAGGFNSSTNNNPFAPNPFRSGPAFVSPTTSPHSGNSSNGFLQGSKVTPYAITRDDSESLNLISISAMPDYRNKSHEELRWEKYELKPGGITYAPMVLMDKSDALKLISISAMPDHESKSHEELRWEDCQAKTGGQRNHPNGTDSINGNLDPIFNPTTIPPITADVSPAPSLNLPPWNPTPPSIPVFPAKSVSWTNGNNVLGNFLSKPLIPQAPQTPNSTRPGMNLFPSESRDESGAMTSGLTLPPVPGSNASVPHLAGQPSFLQPCVPTSEVTPSIVAVKDPFGSQPTNSVSSLIGHSLPFASSQLGIASMPVSEKPAKARVSSRLTSLNLSRRPLTVNARKYHPKSDGPKVPFFVETEEIHKSDNANNYLIPRANPRTVFDIRIELTHVTASRDDESTMINDVSALNHASAAAIQLEDADSLNGQKTTQDQFSSKSSFVEDHSSEVHNTPSACSSSFDEKSKDSMPLLPKLVRSDYYMEPSIQELASRERVEQGFCSHVKDFVVGRHGYGSVKFNAEVDVHGLNLDSLIHFNKQEVVVYEDESEKPPVGQGLNHPAEITLLNINCIDKKTGLQSTCEKIIDKFIEKLKKVNQNQGAEFLSYDQVKGEWKFRVKHF